MARIYFDPVRLPEDGEPGVRATIITYDAEGVEVQRVMHHMTVTGAWIRHGDFAAAIADADAGCFVDDGLRAADILGESHPTGKEFRGHR